MQTLNYKKKYYNIYKLSKKIVVIGALLTTFTLGCISNNNSDIKADDSSKLYNKVSNKDSSSNNLNINEENSTLLSSAQSDPNISEHLKVINGNYFYINSNGSLAKSILINSNGKSYYFNENGYLTDLSKIVPTLGTSNYYNDSNNAIFSLKSNSITNINGFITADSWYRPKKILQNGKKWVQSNPKDFRPILSLWWPNKIVQVNYINYMNKKGLGVGKLTLNSSQKSLDLSAKNIRKNIEKKIYLKNGNVSWLHKYINNFVKSQSEWNLKSENYHLNKNVNDPVDGFQGGSLIYSNNNITSYANSKYRLLNRTPSLQDGKLKYSNSYSGYEMLLANDVDNSNPVVQAEDLNWLYYLMNFGKIVKNDSDANFDSIRIDAVDNMDADLLNISSKYFNLAYKTNKSEKNANNHISILEDWSKNDPYYLKDHNSNQITIDSNFRDEINFSLFRNPKSRLSLSNLIKGLVDRSKDYSVNKAIPNYSMVRAHDNGVQDALAPIIIKYINPKSNGYITNPEELKKAFKIYNRDQRRTNKKYTQYNIPSSYALMLTNKDTIPRLYYGDLFTDDGQFMAHKTLYYRAITSMLKARIKYVAGGQSINSISFNSNSSFNSNNDILTSVRYGKGALSPKDKGYDVTRKSGIAVVESNNPNIKLSKDEKVIIDMGAAHKDQSYRPLINSDKNGLNNYNNDNDTNTVIHTNQNGQLILTSREIKGYSNPQVSGYLSMWVPVGADDKQDIRTKSSDKKNQNGRIINSNSALDSNLIFEGFSNFQAEPTNNSQYENVIIPKKTDLFKSWGVTYMQLPPQYKSTDDNSFLDSTVHDGYSFNDRYDLGFKKPTKYGNVYQLIKTIKSLHSKGIKVMADYVPDQLYSMPKKQIVTASKSDIYGKPILGSNIYNSLYASNTEGSGNDYQSKYGGEFLKTLQKNYPSLFKIKQISTGKPINPSTKIKIWEAKYFNGTNLQGRGAYYVLGNTTNSNYFTVKSRRNKNISKTYIPKQLKGESFKYGLYKTNGDIEYVTSSGYSGKNGFYEDLNKEWYYFNNVGKMVTKPSTINNLYYYFLPNGINLRDFIEKDSDGKMHYYTQSGAKETTPGYYSIDKKNYFYVDKNGSLLTGLHVMKDNGNAKQFFDNDGFQVKGTIINVNGKSLYLDPTSGSAVTKSFVSNNGNTYYSDKEGYFVTGTQKIFGLNLYFYPDGRQAKNVIVNNNGKNYYYDNSFGYLITNRNITINGINYHANSDGSLQMIKN